MQYINVSNPPDLLICNFVCLFIILLIVIYKSNNYALLHGMALGGLGHYKQTAKLPMCIRNTMSA
jgi:hypothetical protein